MKLLFLDIDGVLNRHRTGRDFEPECIAMLNRIVEATGAKLVITSSWRGLIHQGHFSLLGFSRMLRSWGVRGTEVIDYTRVSQGDEPRAAQIADWLRGNRDPGGWRKICIIDNDPDAFGGRPGVRTNGAVGLTVADADDAIRILSE